MIYNAGAFPANRLTAGMGSKTSIDLSLEDREMVILGTEYAGEMKKGVFTIMNYFAPEARRALDALLGDGRQADRTFVAAVRPVAAPARRRSRPIPKRHLIGDDEHCWSDDGIFNIEGGCYAKAINLTPENEPDIFQALRFGAVLENVVLDEDRTRRFHRHAASPQNTRGAYPIEFIRNAKIPCVAGHPTDVIFLTCDAFGVLPPVSSLSPAQAMYHFISGYTAKVAGTEMGVTEPQATFSPCFGGPFLVWHPEQVRRAARREDAAAQRARLAGEHRLERRRATAPASASSSSTRAPSSTRSTAAPCATRRHQRDPVFGFDVVTACPSVPTEIMIPRQAWADASAYDAGGEAARGAVQREFQDVWGRRRCRDRVCGACVTIDRLAVRGL